MDSKSSRNDADVADEFEFTGIPLPGSDELQILNLEAELMMAVNDKGNENANGQAQLESVSMLQIGLKIGKNFGKVEKKLLAMGKEIGELKGENGKLKEELAKKLGEFEEKIEKAVVKNSDDVKLPKNGRFLRDIYLNGQSEAFKEHIQGLWMNWARPIGETIWKERTNVLLLLLFLEFFPLMANHF